MIETTADRFLGGRLIIRQPMRGFRSGLDAVMLAAAVPASDRQHVLELGAGCGVASLCLAARVSGCTISGLEIDPALVAFATENARTNSVTERVEFAEGDALDPPSRLKKEFAHVFANPPFHAADGLQSPEQLRARAKHGAFGPAAWLAAGLKRVLPGGTMTLMIRADRTQEVLASAPPHGLLLFPLWPKARTAAKRMIVQATKGSQAATAFLPGLVLHRDDGSYTEEADSVLRDARALSISTSQNGAE